MFLGYAAAGGYTLIDWELYRPPGLERGPASVCRGRGAYFHFWTENDEGGDPNYPELEGALIVKVQDMCPGRVVYHVDEWEDAAMQTLMEAALERQLQPGVAGAGSLPACPA